jgi:hypothetical protein
MIRSTQTHGTLRHAVRGDSFGVARRYDIKQLSSRSSVKAVPRCCLVSDIAIADDYQTWYNVIITTMF